MNTGGDVEALARDSRLWQALVEGFAIVGLSVSLATLLAAAFLCLICRQAFVYARLVFTATIQYDLVRQVRNSGFALFLNARLGYHDGIRAGDFVNEITTELTQAVTCLTTAITLIAYVLLCVMYVAVLVALSPVMTAVAIATFVLVAVFLRQLLVKTRVAGIALTNANQRTSSFLVERLKSIRLVRLSGMQAAEAKAMEVLTRNQRNQLVSIMTMKALLSVLIEPIIVAVAFVLLFFAYTSFELNFELILLFCVILLRLLPVIKDIMVTRQSILGSLASVEIVDHRLSELRDQPDSAGGEQRLEAIRQGIQFDHVAFSYGADMAEVPALNGIDLHIPAAAVTALVGPSGAGKSTLIDLLPRLRTPQSGRILIDGIPLAEFSAQSLRAAIAYAPQTPQIFNVSAAEHIGYGRSDTTLEEIRAAARLAQADAFISALPDGYDTQLGEGGARLSGGQKQRLDLARALVRQAPILILDEPTSNLDAESEALFREALARIRQETDTIVIIIGHRLSTVSAADQIAVLEDGRVTEIGNHSELISKGGWYAEAFAKQQTMPSTSPMADVVAGRI